MARKQKTETELPKFSYRVVGLQKSETMPYIHRGKLYDLAALTEEEARLLAQATAHVKI